MYTDAGCGTSVHNLGTYQLPTSYVPNFCFSANENCATGQSSGDALTFKIATCHQACSPDGYGCGNEGSGVFDVLGLPQLSCENSQGCLGACPSAIPQAVACAGIQVSGFGFALSGFCPCLLALNEEEKPQRLPGQYEDAINTTSLFYNQLYEFVDVIDLAPERRRMGSERRRMVGNPSGLHGCSLGLALVLDYGQNPQVQIIEGRPT